MQTKRPLNTLDLECYPDYFLAKFFDPSTRRFFDFGMWEGHPLDMQGIADRLAQVTAITFNGNGYDMPMLTLALHGATCAQLKEANDDIIVRKMLPWHFNDKWGISELPYADSIDIMEVAPGVRVGLKAYMARMHSERLQDLPYDPDTRLDGAGRFVIADYCGNDLTGTYELFEAVRERVELRIAMSERYGVDLRSKSDAQIAEAVIKSQLSFTPSKRYIPHGFTFQYQAPPYIKFISPELTTLLRDIHLSPFVVSDREEAIHMWGEAVGVRTGVGIPKALKDRDIRIGSNVYRMGIGGLHSQESSVCYYSQPGVRKLKDIDVKSYYPSMILTMGMVPEQLGDAFSKIFGTIYTRRLSSKAEAARTGDATLQTESDGLKIVLNGTFGKLFSKYSILYAPELGIRTTITGQLALLMLIEMMEACGITVVSANTDGIVLSIPEGLEAMATANVKWWEQRTGMEMEESEYRSIHLRDVNNYVAIDTKGKAKRKGVFGQGGVLSGPQGKGPNMDIVADAVVAFLSDGTPVGHTIRLCTDIRKFLVVRGVSGGGYSDGKYLGKTVRWYYGHGPGVVTKDGDRVAGSRGGVPCMDLPKVFPAAIDYTKYEHAALTMLDDAGYTMSYWQHESDDDDWLIIPGHWMSATAQANHVISTRKAYDKWKAK